MAYSVTGFYLSFASNVRYLCKNTQLDGVTLLLVL